MYAHPGITPTQDEADGRVRINLDAVAEWQAVKAAYLGGNKDPFNVVTSLYHEMVEHSEGARIDYDHFESRGPRTGPWVFQGRLCTSVARPSSRATLRNVQRTARQYRF